MATSPLRGGDLPAKLYNIPGMLPLPGVIPSFDNPYNRGETSTAAAMTITFVMTIIVISRGYTEHFVVRNLVGMTVSQAYCLRSASLRC